MAVDGHNQPIPPARPAIVSLPEGDLSDLKGRKPAASIILSMNDNFGTLHHGKRMESVVPTASNRGLNTTGRLLWGTIRLLWEKPLLLLAVYLVPHTPEDD